MTNEDRVRLALHAAVLKLLRPLCRLLLRHHVPFAAFEELAKHTYVQVALEDFGIPGKKPTLSRASILTGLTRKDVTRLAAEVAPERAASDESYNRAARVLTGWARDPDFRGPDGQPMALEQGRGDDLEVAQVGLALGGMHDADAPGDFLGCVVAAAEQALQARLQRRDLRAEQARLNLFEQVLHHQQRMVFYRDNWYLDAWCHLREEIRSFGVDAIRHAALLEKKAKDVAATCLDEVLGAGYGIFSGDKVQWAKLRFTPEAARWVATEQWHPHQRASFDERNHYLLELPYANPTELVMDILRHGSNVEVLAPESLRRAVRDEMATALLAYDRPATIAK